MSCLGLFLDSKLILEEQREGLFFFSKHYGIKFCPGSNQLHYKGLAAKQLSHEPLH